METMHTHASEHLLHEHGIKPTANRLLVAQALEASPRPLSLSELEERLQTLDRSSIFRALTLFREQHLVHVIEGGGEGVHYELCQSHSADVDDDQHAHFHCERCHRTFCLEDTAVPLAALPEGFVATSVNYLVRGVCASCAYSA